MSRYQRKAQRCFGFLLASAGLLICSAVQAGIPLWTYSAPSSASLTIADGATGTISYTVRNQSHKAKHLILAATPGLKASSCYLPGKDSTCTLTLTVTGNLIPREGIHAGPVLCEQGNPNQCYQPGVGNLLNIRPITGGYLELSQFGVPINNLTLSSGDNGSLLLKNIGSGDVSSLNIVYPFAWQSYFMSNCPAVLTPQQSCSITYTIPIPSAVGILNPLTIQGTGANNSLSIPVSIQTSGALNCWGSNFSGQLGNGNTTNSNTPVTTCSGAGCSGNLSALGLFNHNLGFSSCAIVAAP